MSWQAITIIRFRVSFQIAAGGGNAASVRTKRSRMFWRKTEKRHRWNAAEDALEKCPPRPLFPGYLPFSSNTALLPRSIGNLWFPQWKRKWSGIPTWLSSLSLSHHCQIKISFQVLPSMTQAKGHHEHLLSLSAANTLCLWSHSWRLRANFSLI